MFPGMVGVVVASQITSAVQFLGDVDRLIVDLRGNTGGGIGALRVMSLLTTESLPVGFALDRRRAAGTSNRKKSGFRGFRKFLPPRNCCGLWPCALLQQWSRRSRGACKLKGWELQPFPRTSHSAG